MNIWKLLPLTILLWPTSVYGDQIDIDDFGDEVSLTDFNNLDLSFFNASGLVIDGNTFRTDMGAIRYNADLGISGMDGENLSGFDDLRSVDVEFAVPMFRVGATIGAPGDPGEDPGAPEQLWEASVHFYDENDQQLGSFILGGDAFEGKFAGWQDSQLIHRMRVVDTSANGFVTAIDNLRYEVVPEPSMLVSMLPLAAFTCLRRRSSRRM